ncbi:MAG: alpha/beta fold hydrolase [Alphaproteobacteria bacterium]|nr:alpha/beta fold hydrolase [Alphaproteobacteria bacterium]
MNNENIINYYEHLPLGEGSLKGKVSPKQVVILLHGFGSNGQDLISLAPMWAQSLPDAVFVSPDAPFSCNNTIPYGHSNSYQWFSLQDRDAHKIAQAIQLTVPILDKFITETLERYELSADKLALVGFSQGTMMSLYSGLRYPEKIAGILGYSGSLIDGDSLMKDSDKFNKPLIYLIHGEADDVVPVEGYHHACKTLKSAGFDVSGHTTPNLTHSIDEYGIKSGGDFLRSIFC